MLLRIASVVLLSFYWPIAECQMHFNTPPTMWLERNWQIPENESVGSKIATVHGSDNEGDSLIYGLEQIQPLDGGGDGKNIMEELPFRIDPDTGVVYLNKSLAGKGGQNLRLYVTVFDGELEAKTEVYVNILNANKKPTTSSKFPGQGLIRPPSFPNFPNFNTRVPQPPAIPDNPPISIINNPSMIPKQPHFQEKTYPVRKRNSTQVTTVLRPVTVEDVDNELKTDEKQTTTVASTTVKDKEELNDLVNRNLLPVDQAVKSQPEIATTVVPIVSVCAVFLTVGIIAFVFRKKIYLGKPKDSKDDMRKESSGIVLQEDPGLAMQQWRGPRAFSNRYEPCDRETNYTQSANNNQSGGSPKPADRWEFPRHRLKFFNILGEGAFGQVWKCEALDLEGKDTGSMVVAVKTLKENANEKERSDLISELQVMKMLEPHPNVVRLLGCCTEKEPIFLIMEYISKGKLQSYLRNSRAERYYNNMHGHSKSLTSRDLTSFVYQVAKGMEFLSANGIIHRDLAARNVLITEDHTCKVADFGFARDVIASHVYERKSEGRLPIRWMAPESLYDNIFSVKSDVWSFGVLIWEVVTLGSTPYPGLSAAEVMKKVRDGYRLDKPEHCRRELYNIMYYCWDKDPKERPSFTECVQLLEKLLMTETDYIELERFPDHSYYNMMSLSGEKL